MIKYFRFLSVAIGFSLAGLMSCDEPDQKDSQTAGYMQISVDETYKPVMEEQLKVFLGRYPNAHIQVQYKSEAACIHDFLEDTTRVIFITRELSQQELDYAKSKQIVCKSLAMARDAIAFITAKDAPKKDFTYSDIMNLMTGEYFDTSYHVVFDNTGSSTVRYINDSILHGNTLSPKTYASQTNEEVIHYVASHPKTVGVIGVSWVADHRDSTVETFLQEVNVAGIKPSNNAPSFIKPYQAYIGLKEYPFTRDFYFISKETWVGLGTGLVNYLCRDGQLVFKTAKMFPLRVNVLLKQAHVNQ